MFNNSVRSRRFLLVATLAMCAGAMTISACDDSNDGTDALGGGALTLTAQPGEVALSPGTSGTVEVTVTRSGTVTGPVTLKAGGEPDGLSVSFTPGVLEEGETSASATIAAGEGALSGTYHITLAAVGSNISTGQQQVTVVVSPAPAPPAAR